MVEKQVAYQASFSTKFPGSKQPNLGLLLALASPGTKLEELQDAVRVELEKVKEEGNITERDLDRVKVEDCLSSVSKLAFLFFRQMRKESNSCPHLPLVRHY